ncbi:MAG: DUF5985 family protein [Pseudomonadota bacterium]|nr:MAG: hypothetical protein DIU78_05435 [Pseudomonadota bacterium]
MNTFLLGATTLACAAVALFFFRYWRRSHDRLFAILAAAFGLLMLERIVLSSVPAQLEGRHWIYLVRLLAFVLIIAGVIDKNWPRRRA